MSTKMPQGEKRTGTTTGIGEVRVQKRKGYAFIALVAIALVMILAKGLISPAIPATYPNATLPWAAKAGKAGSGGAAVTAAAPAGYPEITELMAGNNGTITAKDGNYYDWIELYNPTDAAINLGGYALSNNSKKPQKCVLPSYLLGAHGFAVIYASGSPSAADEIHVSFHLKSTGKTVVLSDPGGKMIQAVTYPAMQKNVSYAMNMKDPASWALTNKATPGYPNTDEGYAAFEKSRYATAPVEIDEVMPGNRMTIQDEDGDYSDWIELYNPTDHAVDITGWGLSNKTEEPKRWVFPKTSIEAGQYLVVYASGKNRFMAGKELHTNFHLNSFKDTVILSNYRGQIVSETQYSNIKSDMSWGLDPVMQTWRAFAQPTPGLSNDESGWNTIQANLYRSEKSPVLIEAVLGNNAAAVRDAAGGYPDWIELYNRSGQDINLKGYGLTSKSNKPGLWTFPDVTIKSGGFLSVFATGSASPSSVSSSQASAELDANFKVSSSKGAIVALTAPDGSLLDRCFVPPLHTDIAYGRIQGSMTFSYIDNIKPGVPISNAYAGLAPDPVFSVKAGIYSTDQTVTLSSSEPQAKIYYTLNGDPPSKSSTLYTGPIVVKKPSAKFGATVIRAVAYKDGYLHSDIMTNTYIIGQNIDLPVISISVDNNDMFNPSTGLYEKGPNAKPVYPFVGANFDKRGKNGELPAHLEMIDPNNPKRTDVISQDCGIQIFGQFSRGDVLKGFELVARSVYGNNLFDCQVFPDLPYTSYKSILSRPGGQDVKRTGMRDMLTISLARDTIPIDKAAGGPSVLTQDVRLALEFVNGEFWGVTTLHEKIDARTIAKHYPGANAAKIDLIDTTGKAKAGSNKDYLALIEYAKTHDLSNADNYKWVTDRMDIDSYINWFTLELCCGNSDYGNIRLWKSSALDNKFRWIYYDFCWAFDNINRSDISLDIASHKASSDGYLIRALLGNPDFKSKFLKQLAYNISITFEPNRVTQTIDQISTAMTPYMDAEDAKWHDISYQGTNASGAQGYAGWGSQVDLLRKYAQQHPALLKAQMKSYFNLTDAQMKQLFGGN